MSHGVTLIETKPKIEKASLLQALAVKEIEEVQSLRNAQLKAKTTIEEAEQKSADRAVRLETELKDLEAEILNREVKTGEKEAAQIAAQAEKERAEKVQNWQKNINRAVQNLVEKILKVDS